MGVIVSVVDIIGEIGIDEEILIELLDKEVWIEFGKGVLEF